MGSPCSLTANAPSAYSKLCGFSAPSTSPLAVCAIVLMCRVCSSLPFVHLRRGSGERELHGFAWHRGGLHCVIPHAR